MPKQHSKGRKITAIFIVFLLIGSDFLKPAWAYDFSEELYLMLLQTQVEEARAQLRSTVNKEELNETLETLEVKGYEAIATLKEIQRDPERMVYERRLNTTTASVIGGLRFILNRPAHADIQLKAAKILLGLNQRLFGVMAEYSEKMQNGTEEERLQAALNLKELMPLFGVLPPLVLNLRHSDPQVRAKMFENLTYFNRYFSLLKEAELTSETKKEIDLSPYLNATLPALKYALRSEETPIQRSVLQTLTQIQSLEA